MDKKIGKIKVVKYSKAVGYSGQQKLEILKKRIVSRLFWGRSAFYKTFTHSLMIIVTVAMVITGIFNRFAPKTIATDLSYQGDILTSGTSIETINLEETGNLTRIKYHEVKEGDTLESIAIQYNLKEDTVRWANIRLIGPFSKNIQVGWQLKIPPFDGVLYRVKEGDTVEKLAADLQSDFFTITELNNLKEPDYKLTVGEDIMIPDGRLRPVDITDISQEQLYGAFEDPLSHPACTGYSFYGGIGSYPGHNGVDLGFAGGCPIRAIAAGTVYYTGWEDLSGYTVKIDHGGGLRSYYYHGNGEIWVKNGQYVEQGTDLMMMGCTGNCFGTHLHLTIKLNNQLVDPVKYIPLKVFGY